MFLPNYPWFAFDGEGGSTFYDPYTLSYFQTMRPAAIIGGSIYLYRIHGD